MLVVLTSNACCFLEDIRNRWIKEIRTVNVTLKIHKFFLNHFGSKSNELSVCMLNVVQSVFTCVL